MKPHEQRLRGGTPPLGSLLALALLVDGRRRAASPGRAQPPCSPDLSDSWARCVKPLLGPARAAGERGVGPEEAAGALASTSGRLSRYTRRFSPFISKEAARRGSSRITCESPRGPRPGGEASASAATGLRQPDLAAPRHLWLVRAGAARPAVRGGRAPGVSGRALYYDTSTERLRPRSRSPPPNPCVWTPGAADRDRRGQGAGAGQEAGADAGGSRGAHWPSNGRFSSLLVNYWASALL